MALEAGDPGSSQGWFGFTSARISARSPRCAMVARKIASPRWIPRISRSFTEPERVDALTLTVDQHEAQAPTDAQSSRKLFLTVTDEAAARIGLPAVPWLQRLCRTARHQALLEAAIDRSGIPVERARRM